jgi:hypothetical protein
MTPHQFAAVPLWIAHTFDYGRFTVTLRLMVTSPVRGCGKTTLLDLLEALCVRPRSLARGTSSAPATWANALDTYEADGRRTPAGSGTTAQRTGRRPRCLPSTRDHLRLVVIVAQACERRSLPFEEVHRLVVQEIVDPASIELGTPNEPPRIDAAATALAIGQQVEAVLDHRREQPRAPAATVEHNGNPAFANQVAYFAKQAQQGLG